MTKGEKFNKTITKYLNEIGTNDNSNIMDTWIIDTLYGKLNVHLPKPTQRQKLFTIFTRFDEPNRVNENLHTNPHSVKWNFHISDMDEYIKVFKHDLNKILLQKKY